jgi:hypothetical protein
MPSMAPPIAPRLALLLLLLALVLGAAAGAADDAHECRIHTSQRFAVDSAAPGAVYSSLRVRQALDIRDLSVSVSLQHPDVGRLLVRAGKCRSLAARRRRGGHGSTRRAQLAITCRSLPTPRSCSAAPSPPRSSPPPR